MDAKIIRRKGKSYLEVTLADGTVRYLPVEKLKSVKVFQVIADNIDFTVDGLEVDRIIVEKIDGVDTVTAFGEEVDFADLDDEDVEADDLLEEDELDSDDDDDNEDDD